MPFLYQTFNRILGTIIILMLISSIILAQDLLPTESPTPTEPVAFPATIAVEPTSIPFPTATETATFVPEATPTETNLPIPLLPSAEPAVDEFGVIILPTPVTNPIEEQSLFSPTVTPSSQLFSAQTCNSVSYITSNLAIIEADDYCGLHNAINIANANPSLIYKIFLKEGVYNISATIVIFGNVEIYGRGTALTFIRQSVQPPAMNGIFAIAAGRLLLDNVSVENGVATNNASQGRGAGVWVQNATSRLEATNSRFRFNNAVFGGGIYLAAGSALLQRVTFARNTAERGGAIHSNASTVNNVTGTCITFSNNQSIAAEGGAVFNNSTSGTLSLQNGSFNSNTSISTRPLDAHVFAVGKTTVTINASNNFWSPAAPASSTNLRGVNTSRQLSTQPSCAPLAPVAIPPIPTPTPTPALSDFGVMLYDEEGQRWNPTEVSNILAGVNRIADAFSRFQALGNTGPQRFRLVIGESVGFLRLANPRPSNTQYGIYHNEFDNKQIVSGYCQVFGASAVIPTIVVACRSAITNSSVWVTNGLVTEYSVVHELGHVLDLRSDLVLRGYVGSNELFLADCSTPITRVMGVSSGTSWNRGQRGWGTASVNPVPPPNQRLSQFQQNPEDTPIEAAADMFLNWVYRRTTDVAPTGIPVPFDPLANDDPAPIAACNYPNTGNWAGFANILDTGATDTSNAKAGNVRYWWIEGTLDRIFRDSFWK